MTDDIRFEDDPCPRCGTIPTHSKPCDVIGCDDGYMDEHDCDPINYAAGEAVYPCPECCGTGNQRWCPKCGLDITRRRAGATDPIEGGN